jgi:hypothetical protein
MNHKMIIGKIRKNQTLSTLALSKYFGAVLYMIDPGG